MKKKITLEDQPAVLKWAASGGPTKSAKVPARPYPYYPPVHGWRTPAAKANHPCSDEPASVVPLPPSERLVAAVK